MMVLIVPLICVNPLLVPVLQGSSSYAVTLEIDNSAVTFFHITGHGILKYTV